MANGLEKLLMAIVNGTIMRDESREAQLDATAVQDVGAEVRAIAQDHREDARRLAPYFAEGLRRAAQGPLVVDDTEPEGNAIADALARYIVAPDLGTSRSTPIGENHFRYTFEIDWPRLQQIAAGNGIDLQAALREG